MKRLAYETLNILYYAVISILAWVTIEALALITRFEKMPADFPLRILLIHLIFLVPLVLCMALAKFFCKGTSIWGAVVLVSLVILTTGKGNLEPLPLILGIVVVIALLIGIRKWFGAHMYPGIFFLSITIFLASLLAKGSLLEPGGWINASAAVLWVLIAVGLLSLDKKWSAKSWRHKADTGMKWSMICILLVFPFWGIIFPTPSVKQAPVRSGATGANILLIVVDTVRPEAVVQSPSGPPAMPELLQYGEKNLLLPNFFTSSPSSLPTHASLFTGLPSSIHGAHKPAHDDPNPPFYAYKLEKSFVTLAERFQQAGYATVAVSGNYGPLAPAYGLNQGFDVYDASRNKVHRTLQKTLMYRCIPVRRLMRSFWFGYDAATPYRNARMITDLSLQYLDQMQGKMPFFLFINLFDTHSPYLPPNYWELRKTMPGSEWIEDGEPLPKRAEAVVQQGERLSEAELRFLWALFRAEMTYVDQQLKRILDNVDQGNTLVVILSDHGESLGEHSLLKHTNTVYQQEIAVPCVVSFPSSEKLRKVVSNMQPRNVFDLHDMMLTAAGLEPPVRPKSPGFFSETFSAQHPRYSNGVRSLFTGEIKSLLQPPWKFIWHSDGYHQLFNLETDPGELNNLATTAVQLTTAMDDTLTQYLEAYKKLYGTSESQDADLSSEDKEALKRLGYIQ